MLNDTLSRNIIDNYGDRPQSRAIAEVVAEVNQLCRRAAAIVLGASDVDEPQPEVDGLRKQAIGTLWGAGIHYLHAEVWVDETISDATFDLMPFP